MEGAHYYELLLVMYSSLIATGWSSNPPRHLHLGLPQPGFFHLALAIVAFR